MDNDYKRNRHAYYNLKYHLVVTTKNKYRCLTDDILQRLKRIIEYLLLKWDCILSEFYGDSFYIHVFFEAPPQVQLSKLINNLKTVTARLIRKEYAEYLSKFYDGAYLWSSSYLIASYGSFDRQSLENYLMGNW